MFICCKDIKISFYVYKSVFMLYDSDSLLHVYLYWIFNISGSIRYKDDDHFRLRFKFPKFNISLSYNINYLCFSIDRKTITL